MRLRLILLAFFIAAIGVILFTISASNLSKELAARSWSKVDGVVKNTSVTVSKGRNQTLWCPRWEYHYTVDNQSYTGNRAAIGAFPCAQSQRLAQERLKTHPINSSIQVMYDPENPHLSTLQISDDGGFLWWFLLIPSTIVLFCSGRILYDTLKHPTEFLADRYSPKNK